MKAVVFGLIVALSCAYTLAHICLLNPHQRGSMEGLNKNGSNDCILLDSPCGKRPLQTPTTFYMTGETYPIVFQKNLDHFDSNSPGEFQVNLWEEGSEKPVANLLTVPDTNTSSLTLYNVNITIPKDVTKDKVYQIQVTYVTNNPKAPKEFFQCADVLIYST